jgi:hypothetical protein
MAALLQLAAPHSDRAGLAGAAGAGVSRRLHASRFFFGSVLEFLRASGARLRLRSTLHGGAPFVCALNCLNIERDAR